MFNLRNTLAETYKLAQEAAKNQNASKKYKFYNAKRTPIPISIFAREEACQLDPLTVTLN